MISTPSWVGLLVLAGALGAPLASAQENKAAPPPKPDIIIFANGDKLAGQLVRSTGSSVVFKSDMLGEITVDWSKIKELQTTKPYAVVAKDVKLGKHEDTGKIPQGNLSVADQKIEVHPAGGQSPTTVPVAQSAYVVDETTFQNAVMHKAGLLEYWKTAITLGATLVEATQNSRNFAGAINLSRSLPTESWMERRNRTTLNFSGSSGRVTQPGSPSLKTEIYHADAERDEYFTPRVFAFGQVAFDHNFSQGLDLQQNYGGGFGWTALKTENQELDLKVSMDYIGQSFQNAAVSQHLIGSNFGQTYFRKLPRGASFNEQLTILPAWSNTSALSSALNMALIMPVYKHFSVTLGTTDNYLNNPPPGFKRLSFQFTTGLTYTFP